MKKLKTTLYVLMLTPFAMSAIAFGFLPDRIPAHYGFDGMVTRYGSRWEVFLGPILYAAGGLFMHQMARFARKQEPDGQNNEKVIIISGVAMMLIFNVLAIRSLYTAHRQVENLYAEFDLVKVMFSLIGLALIIIGNVMPKLKRNSIAGLRTKWSLSSERAWRKSQRFGGITLMITGLLLLLGNMLVFPRTWALPLSTGLFIISVLTSIIYSYWAARKE
ncbi:MAG: DUF1648 domain-containing protein [Firmicutes bacterium]|nr:DUF1648 domain-containing protein [Bacillota bacterium]